LIAGHLSRARLDSLLETFDSPSFSGHPDLQWDLPPNTSPEALGFHPQNYWRGPPWPVVNWLLTWSLERTAEGRASAARIADAWTNPGPPPLPSTG